MPVYKGRRGKKKKKKKKKRKGSSFSHDDNKRPDHRPLAKPPSIGLKKKGRGRVRRVATPAAHAHSLLLLCCHHDRRSSYFLTGEKKEKEGKRGEGEKKASSPHVSFEFFFCRDRAQGLIPLLRRASQALMEKKEKKEGGGRGKRRREEKAKTDQRRWLSKRKLNDF